MRIQLDYSDSQISSPDSFYAHPDYRRNFYRISKPHGVTPVVMISTAMNRLFWSDRRCLDL